MAKITKTLVDNAKAPATGAAFIWDTELQGFGICIQASGRKSYLVRYRTKDASKTQRKLTIARCSDMPPDRARDQARKIFAQVAEGMDPAAERKPVKTEQTDATVERMFEGYVASMRALKRESAVEVERALLKAKDNAADALGRTRPAAEVTPGDVVKFVSLFFKRGHRGAADKARSYISSAFAWAIKSANDYTVENAKDWGVTHNPAADVAKDPGAKTTRERNLSASELRALWHGVEDAGFSLEVASCIRMLIGCGQRVQETLRIEGREIDLVAAQWNMPKEKTKGRKRAHSIPLPQQVLPVLQLLVDKHGDGPLFPAHGKPGQIIGHRSVNQAIGRWLEDAGLEHFQTRDLRRTWKSRSHDAGIDRFTRDLLQQHAKSDTGSKVYDRADYLPQMRLAMMRWSAWLGQVLDGQTPEPVPVMIPGQPLLTVAA